MNKKSIMIVGYGSVGQYLLDMLMHYNKTNSKIDEIVVVSRSSYEDKMKRLNTSIIAGGLSNNYTKVSYIQCDMSDTDQLSNIIKRVSPKVIVQCARYYSGVKYGSFSYTNGIGYGVWSPMSVVPIYKLMNAVCHSGVDTKVINTSYPDVTNAWLKSFNSNLTPFCGAGNINHLIPRIKYAVNMDDPESVNVNLICSHYTNTYVSKEGSPRGTGYYLQINGETVGCVKSQEIFSKCSVPMNSDSIRNLMIATDCFMLIRGLAMKESMTIHIPGYDGRVGGQRYRIEKGVVKDDLPEGISQAFADNVNMTGINDDLVDDIVSGDIVFSSSTRSKMIETFGIPYPSYVNVSDAEKLAENIMSKLIEYKESH